MKLIELLVQELPKRGGWPEGVAAMAQDADGAVQNYSDTCDIIIDDCYARGKSRILNGYSIKKGEVVTVVDRLTAVITREQYEAALAETEWDGEGLPPVGCECERSWCGDKWLPCTVLFISDETVVVKLATREAAYGTNDVKFRPIRSEADKTIEAMRKFAISNDETIIHSINRIYDAISAGKIPGVKLSD